MKKLLLFSVLLFSLCGYSQYKIKNPIVRQLAAGDTLDIKLEKDSSNVKFVTDKDGYTFDKPVNVAGVSLALSLGETSTTAFAGDKGKIAYDFATGLSYVDTLSDQNIYGAKVFYGTVIAPSIKMTTLYNDSGLVLISNENTKTTFSRGDTTFITMADTTIRAQKNLVAPKFYVSALNEAPASATAEGTTGEIRITTGYIYVCVSDDVWVRTELTTWP